MFFTREDREKFEAKSPAAKFAVHLEQKYGLHLNHIGEQELAKEIQDLLDSQKPAPAPMPDAIPTEGGK